MQMEKQSRSKKTCPKQTCPTKSDCYCLPQKWNINHPQTSQFDPEVLKKMKSLRENGKFLDLELKSTDEYGITVARKAHKYVINSLSVDLAIHFIEGTSIPCPVDVLDAIIELAYTGNLDFEDDAKGSNIGHLLKIAITFKINFLKMKLAQYMLSNLTLDNALQYYNNTSQNGFCPKDIHIIRQFILKKNFMTLNRLSAGFQFPTITNLDLESFVMDDNLGVKEIDLFNLIMEWTNNDFPDREFLLKHVRYKLMSPVDFHMKNVAPIIQSRTKPGAKPMKSRNPNETVLVIGGWSSGTSNQGDGPCGHIEAGGNFDVANKPWKAMKFPLNHKRAYHGIGQVKNEVIIFGGFDKLLTFTEESYPKSTFAFDTIKKVWTDKQPMNERRCYVASATLKDKIYACGGFDGRNRLRSAEIYDPSLDQWSILPSMLRVRSDAACVAFDGKIYVIGGFDGEQIHQSVEIFNPRTEDWSFGPQLNHARSGVKACVYHNKIFVIGGYDGIERLKSVEVLDPASSPNWQCLINSQLMVRRSNFAVTVTDDKILVAGGYDGHGVTNKTEMYDDKTKVWKRTKPMSLKRSALEMVTLDNYLLNYKDFV